MKKFVTAIAAAALMMFSVVPAFAVNVDSPVATTQPDTTFNGFRNHRLLGSCLRFGCSRSCKNF